MGYIERYKYNGQVTVLATMEKFWTVQEAAQKYRRSEKTIRAMIRKGEIEAIKFGRDWRIIPFDHYRFAEIRFHRSIVEDLKLMRSAKESIWVLGINALGPLHQGREILITALNAGKRVRVLLLDPASGAFAERARIEEEIVKNGKTLVSGRLRAESAASLAICHDIVNFIADPALFEVRVHREDPTEALVLVDAESPNHAVCHYNPYPLDKQTRGLCGPNISLSRDPGQPDNNVEFKQCYDRYTELWEKGTVVGIRTV
jgi:excisionase family DNA binding protein